MPRPDSPDIVQRSHEKTALNVFILALSAALPQEIRRVLNFPVRSFLFHTLFLSSQLSRNARMLTSFPPLFSEVREKRGSLGGGGNVAGDCAGFVEVGNFPFLFSVSPPCLSLYIQQCLPCPAC